MIAVYLVLFAVLLAGIAVSTRNWWVGRGRPQSLAALAAERGLTYVPRDDRHVPEHGHPFGIGRNHRCENVLFGEVAGRKVLAFDYAFALRQAIGGWRTHRFGVVMVRLPAALPELEIVEEGPQDKPDTFLGLDFVVTQDADFNQRFRVRAADRHLAAEILQPWTQKALMACPPLRLRIRGREAISWKRGRLGLGDLDRHLSAIGALIDGISPTVWIDYRGGFA